MGKCGCSGDGCSCALVAGQRISITGNGSAQNPYRITSDPINLIVNDTATINLTLGGEGTSASPYTLAADFVGTLPAPDWTPAQSRTWSGTPSLADLTVPNTIRVALTGNVTAITLPTWASSGSGSIVLVLTQDATGGRTVAFTGVTWAGGTPPTLSTAPSARDVIRLFWTGLSWVGSVMALHVS